MATNWWEEYETVAPANDPGFTGFIPGKPKENKPPSGYIRAPDGSLVPEKGGPADPYRPGGELDPNKPAKDGEAKSTQALAASFYSRALASHRAYDQGIDPRDPVTQTVVDVLPQNWTNPWTAPKRRAAQNYVEEFIRAKLRKESGAAIPDPEMAREYPVYFPVPGDTKDDLERKRLLREQVIEGLRVSAGSAADQVKIIELPKLSDYDAGPPEEGESGASDQSLASPAAAATGGSGGDNPRDSVGVSELTADQRRAYEGFWAGNPDPTPEQLTAFLAGIGIPRVGNAAEIIQAVKEGRGVADTVIDTDYRTKLEQRLKQQEEIGVGAESATETLAKQGATLNLSDEAGGVGNAISNVLTSPFTGDFDPFGAYRFGRDLERLRIADAREQLGYGGTAIELAGGLAAAGPAGALAHLAPRQAAIQAGRAGLYGGALAGFGAGEGTGESLTGAAAGAGLGYTIGRYGPALLEKGAGLLPRRLRQPRGMAPDVAAAADAEGVDLIRPMVDPNSISDFGALESNIYSQPIIRGAQARVAGQIEDKVGDLAAGGTPLETEAAGGAIQNAARRFIQRSRGVANTLYNRARSLSGDKRFTPAEALKQVDEELAQLGANPKTNAGEIRFLKGLRRDLSADGGKTIEELRGLRQSLRGRINEQDLTATQAEARAIRVLDATHDDARASLPQGAATAYRRADTYYRERMVHIDDVLDRFLGGNVERGQARLSGEQAFQRLKSMTSPGGDGRRLAALMRDLEPNERQDIAATIAHSLGRRSADEPFSTALFLSQTRKLSPSARRTIFGPDGAQSIDNLRLLSRKLEEAGKDINRSRSATVLERQGWLAAARNIIAGLAGLGGAAATGSMAGGAAGLAVAGAAMGGSAARRILSARAMVNPRVSRWLAEGADVSTKRQAEEATRKLGVIIAREPALAHELQPIHAFLTQRLSQPLAAEPQAEGEDDER